MYESYTFRVYEIWFGSLICMCMDAVYGLRNLYRIKRFLTISKRFRANRELSDHFSKVSKQILQNDLRFQKTCEIFFDFLYNFLKILSNFLKI